MLWRSYQTGRSARLENIPTALLRDVGLRERDTCPKVMPPDGHVLTERTVSADFSVRNIPNARLRN
jgi:hypothetical protein